MSKAPKTVVVVGALPDSLTRFRGPLLASIARAGHRVIGCASVNDTLAQERDPAGALRALGAEFRDIPFDRTGFNPNNDLRVLASLKALFREVRPDVVLSYTIKPNLYATMAARAARVPHVCALVSGIGYGLEGEVRQRPVGRAIVALHRHAFRSVDAAIFQNPDDRQVFRDLGILRARNETVIVNGSGVDTNYFEDTPFPDGETTFLLVGRLMKDKGVFEYAAAAEALRARGIPARFLIAGFLDTRPGSLTPEQLDHLCAANVLEYLGVLADVRPAIARSHVYVLPSYHEGTPRTVLEAMSAGRPIVTTDARGCRETTTDGVNGYLVPVGDAPRLAEAMMRYIENPDLVRTHGAASRRIAVEKYDVVKVNEAMMRAMKLLS